MIQQVAVRILEISAVRMVSRYNYDFELLRITIMIIKIITTNFRIG